MKRVRDKEKYNAYQREYSKNHPEQKMKSVNRWISLNKDKVKKHQRNSYEKNVIKTREEIIRLLGSKCSRCGFSDIRALQIDHVHGNGAKERKKLTSPRTYYQAVIKSINHNETKYQLLCANCNWIKKYENNEK